MTQCCSCCGGGPHRVPSSPSNRPGLSKLEYRLGTYGLFYSTMLSRLSSSDYPEMRGLRTRESTDFSIGYLDACAVVADVLCFYQERLVNEGYLDTAIERRSLVELSRLIGYVPRPGVSASAYLAYTLERNSAHVEIPKGSKASTVPGPGEDMQTFETAEPLVAREEWNAIRPRLKMPQSVGSICAFGLYLKGTATRLKPGDRLLIKFGAFKQRYYARVDALTAFDEEQYTLVTLKFAPTGYIPDLLSYSAREFIEQARMARLQTNAKGGVSYDELENRIVTIPVGKDAPETITNAAETMSDVIAQLHKSKHPVDNDLGNIFAMIGESLLWQHRMAPYIVGKQPKSALPSLVRALSVPPVIASQLHRSAADAFKTDQETIPRVLSSLQPQLASTLYTAWSNLPPPSPLQIEVHAMRIEARPFGHNAPLRLVSVYERRHVMKEWRVDDPLNSTGNLGDGEDGGEKDRDADHHQQQRIFLDSGYDIEPDGFAIIETADNPIILDLGNGMRVKARSLAAYGLSGKTVELEWYKSGNEEVWLDYKDDSNDEEEATKAFAVVRKSRVFAGSERLELAQRPINSSICGDSFELDGLYEGLEAGRWLVVGGERTDIPDGAGKPVPGVFASELVMLSAIEQSVNEAKEGETYHSRITLAAQSVNADGETASGLAYCYKRDTVTINANVVRATHGETRLEVLGSGNAVVPFQRFDLKQLPLTHVSAPTPAGTESTLEVLVNGIAWRETQSLAGEGATARKFFTRTDDDGKTSVIFGDGKHGQRLPTGRENIRAIYRNGIGRPGNVKAKQISLLASRPLGVKEVINPARASGGADREGLLGIRRNAPASVTAFDRLVSVEDYEDFARTFGGVGKAVAGLVPMPLPRGPILHVTITGDADDPLDPGSDLFRNLKQALTRYGDADVRIQLASRKRSVVVISANVKLAPDCRWEFVEPKIRVCLLENFGFERVELGGTIFRSAVFAAIQSIEGVDYVDIDVLDALDEDTIVQSFVGNDAVNLQLKEAIRTGRAAADSVTRIITPAGLAYLAPDLPDTLILQEIKP
jgi:hypothetical protein